MELYLIKSSLALLVFFLGYELVLRRDTFFLRNRIYLFSSLVFSFILPLLPLIPPPSFIHAPIHPQAEAGMLILNEGIPTNVQTGELSVSAGMQFEPMYIVLMVYFTGLLFMAVRFVNQGLFILRLVRRSKTGIIDGRNVYFHRETVSHFSFFHYIFINERLIMEPGDDLQKILNHELVHVRHYHSLDILACEIASILFWFNPILWIYRKRMQENHEFMADQQVVSSGYLPAEYQAVLVNQALGIPVFSLTNKFNQVHLKKRIDMLRKIKSSPKANLKLFALVPFLAALLLLSGWRNKPVENQDGKVVIHGKVIESETNNPLEGAAVIIANTTEGTVTDAQGNFTINVNIGSELVFSYVGFETSRFKISNEKDVIARLKRKAIALEGAETSPKSDKFMEAWKGLPYFLDGKELSPEEVNSLNSQIASVTILKGDEAIKKYGEKGKNGVAEINLKSRKDIKSQSKDPMKEDSEQFTIVEDMPQFPGGNDAFREYINKNLKYPESAANKQIQGKVFVSFMVGTDGGVKNVQVVRGVDSSLDAEAVRVIRSSPVWKPGTQRGKPVEASFTIPVDFKLNQNGEIFANVDEMPTFQNGDMDHFRKYVAEHVVYPESAKQNKITGKVFVQFVVSPLGKVNDVKVVRGVSEALDQEAVRVIQSSPDWTPGKQKGKKVAVQFTIPVSFALN